MTKIFAFDLDGTIVNSLHHTFQVLREAAAELGQMDLSAEKIIQHLGTTEEVMLTDIYGPSIGMDIADLYVKRFTEQVEKVEVFPGMLEIIKELKNRGRKVALFTARGRRATDPILNHLGLQKHFDVIVTGTEVLKTKPDPEGLFKIAKALNTDIRNLLYSGDSPKDVQMANSAGARSVAVAWCPLSKEDQLRKANPREFFSTVPSFREFILKLA